MLTIDVSFGNKSKTRIQHVVQMTLCLQYSLFTITKHVTKDAFITSWRTPKTLSLISSAVVSVCFTFTHSCIS